jgi:hypothetical protein
MNLPVLEIRRSVGDDALLEHRLTEDERTLFKEMDSATAALPAGTELAEYHRVVSAVGAGHGLGRRQSIAFWTRTTFSTFEV